MNDINVAHESPTRCSKMMSRLVFVKAI